MNRSAAATTGTSSGSRLQRDAVAERHVERRGVPPHQDGPSVRGGSTMRSRLAATVVAVIATAGLAMPTSATVAGPTSRDHGTGVADVVDASGIALVGPEAIQFRAENEAQALAFDAALNLALANRPAVAAQPGCATVPPPHRT